MSADHSGGMIFATATLSDKAAMAVNQVWQDRSLATNGIPEKRDFQPANLICGHLRMSTNRTYVDEPDLEALSREKGRFERRYPLPDGLMESPFRSETGP
ncbi:hypothetical protein U1Q18_024062 [Sarracenia purpurea var. burkii]